MGSFISKLLQTDAFTYSVAGLAAIHRAIFEGVFKHAGRFRDYDISKKEWKDTISTPTSTPTSLALRCETRCTFVNLLISHRGTTGMRCP